MEEAQSTTYLFNQRTGESAGVRASSFLIDGLLVAIASSALATPLLLSTISGQRSFVGFLLAWMGLFVLLQFFYNAIAEGLTGTTLGKRFGVWPMSLRVVRVDGAPVGFRESTIRALFGMLEQSNLLGWIASAISISSSASAQRFGDRAAGTLVVDRSKAETVTIDPQTVTFRMLDGRALRLSRLASAYVTTWLGKPQWLKVVGTDPDGAPVKLAFRMTRGATVFVQATEVQWLRTELERRFQTAFEERLETWRIALVGGMLLLSLSGMCSLAFFIPLLAGLR